MTHTVRIEVSDETLAALRRDPGEYAQDLRLAAAAKLYELGRVSQEVAADIAGPGREEFLKATVPLRNQEQVSVMDPGH